MNRMDFRLIFPSPDATADTRALVSLSVALCSFADQQIRIAVTRKIFLAFSEYPFQESHFIDIFRLRTCNSIYIVYKRPWDIFLSRHPW